MERTVSRIASRAILAEIGDVGTRHGRCGRGASCSDQRPDTTAPEPGGSLYVIRPSHTASADRDVRDESRRSDVAERSVGADSGQDS